MAWTWQLLDAQGMAVPAENTESFTNQSDAESWLGEHWRALAASGVTSVKLLEGDREEYEMSLAAD